MTTEKPTPHQNLLKISERAVHAIGVFVYKHPKLGVVVRRATDPIITTLLAKKYPVPQRTLPTTQKKRLFIVMTYLGVGGVEQVMLNIIKGFDRSKYDLQLVTTVKHDNPWHDRFSKHVDDILHLENDGLFKPHQPNAFKRVFLSSYIIDSNPHAILMTNSLLFYHLLPRLRKGLPSLPIYDILHTHGTPDQNDAYLKLSKPFDKYLTKRIVINEYLKQYYVKKYRINPEKIKVIYNNITPIGKISKMTNSQEKIFNKHLGKSIVTYIGRLELDKSPVRLVNIAKQLLEEKTAAVIIVVGDGSQMEQLKNQSRRDGTLGKTIELIGYSDCPARAAQLSNYTLLVSTMEGLPMSILESMSMSVPSIASAVGGIPEIIEDKKDGFLVPIDADSEQKTVDEFTKAIVTASSLDSKALTKMQKSAKQKITQKFSSMAEEYNAIVD
ncbi:glycosyltransferase family 4 protein [Candidatus Saccharibacteria bacterium]|nr:glycosyltransferase family 4 protein [Candidatus Saccharibacteria bacterium]